MSLSITAKNAHPPTGRRPQHEGEGRSMEDCGRALAGQAPFPRVSVWRRVCGHPLVTVFVLALLVRLLNVALLRGDEPFFAELDTRGYWELGAALAKPGA